MFEHAYSITLTKGNLHHNVSNIVYGEVGRCAVSVYRCDCLYTNAIDRSSTEVPETPVGHLVQSYCVITQ